MESPRDQSPFSIEYRYTVETLMAHPWACALIRVRHPLGVRSTLQGLMGFHPAVNAPIAPASGVARISGQSNSTGGLGLMLPKHWGEGR